MSIVNIANAKNVDHKLQCLVFGYMKSVQSSVRIPIEIFYLCILFLFEFEYFEIAGDGVIISEDKMTVTKDESSHNTWQNTSYGKFIAPSISKSIVTWIIKIGNSGHAGNICMGITSSG